MNMDGHTYAKLKIKIVSFYEFVCHHEKIKTRLLACEAFDLFRFLNMSLHSCRDIALRYTARALARVILITNLISANQMLCMII